ncbi:hypothetical protein GCM10010123_33890 [Pilimelia anulata]|uniref:Peptidase S8/S53 domain-containing protein n=1 Tax=Pilimelia anulata TaxID=53371 RepID=A0A8J3BG21_9ACTN|nr:hypothetical protein GCM10010123_33890 [Pilimelia anulata]
MWARRAAVGLAGALATAGLTGTAPAAATPAADLDVIVRTAAPADAAAAGAAVRRLGGAVGRPLDVISGFTARVPRAAVPALRAAPGVAAVTADAPVRLKAAAPPAPTGEKWRDDGGKGAHPAAIKKAATKPGPRGGPDAGALTGAGIGVAMIDSGVTPVAGLDGPGKVVQGPDLSFESQAPDLAGLDTYGHGTHMAGIIAGSDAATPAGAARFDGVAPGARIVSLKVAAADGASDVSQVLAAIDWVVAHRDDKDLNIRVLNLSFGTDTTQDPRLDPLSYAVESAWRKGIVVVVSVGNDGAEAPRVTMPAANPYVIAVGAVDGRGTDDRADDRVAAFSSRGSATRHADVVAAGTSVVSLRTPGSYIDNAYPSARLADAAGEPRLFRGSGTSQAAAVVSGTVALLLQQRPALTPDQVKRLLVDSADPIAGADSVAAGAGQVDLGGAAALAVPGPKEATQAYPAATGLGSLDASRGTARVADESGAELTGERDIFGSPWDARRWAPQAREGKSWKDGTWNGNTWTGRDFTGPPGNRRWATGEWTGRSWTGRSWTSDNWTGRSWTGRSWTGRSWTTGTWFGRSWTGRSWS